MSCRSILPLLALAAMVLCPAAAWADEHADLTGRCSNMPTPEERAREPAPDPARIAAAEKFVRDIYAHYTTRVDGEVQGVSILEKEAAQKFFTPTTATLIADDIDRVKNTGEIHAINADLFTGAQDLDFDWSFVIKLTDHHINFSSFSVKIKSRDDKEAISEFILCLDYEYSWKIHDIIDKKTSDSLRQSILYYEEFYLDYIKKDSAERRPD